MHSSSTVALDNNMYYQRRDQDSWLPVWGMIFLVIAIAATLYILTLQG